MTGDGELLVAEMFGPTLQGEGPSCGRQAVFVRLSRCNLSCPQCDTPYTWDWSMFDPREQTRRLTCDEVARWVLDRPAELAVLTGGEPLLQQDRLIPLVAQIATAGRSVEVETNGTVIPSPHLAENVSRFNVSPKLVSFAGPRDTSRRINDDALRALAESGRATFKFVASALPDLDEIADLQLRHGLSDVWVMPEGVTAARTIGVARELADEVVARGWNLTLRLHVLLWGDQRGR